ncbi:MAG: hypothetical protein HND47_23010 [Chloroflexi bacterium]|nr:hypothetical protein [Chloroflexota bacterium]
MKKSMILLFITALTLSACLSPTPQVTVTSKVTVTSTLEPTPTPAPTATPALSPDVELTEKEKQILSAAPETYSTPEGDLPKSWSEKYGMPVYANKNGEIVAIWLADKRDVTIGNQQEATMVDGILTTIDNGGQEKKIYSAVAVIELENNQFSGVKIFTRGERFRENPTVSQDQLPEMRNYLITLYNDKQLRQLEIGKRGAMQLGPSFDKVPDFVMSETYSDSLKEVGCQPMYNVLDNERKTFRWDSPDTRPVLVAFPFDKGGVILAQLILDKNQNIDVMGWHWMHQEWLNIFSSETEHTEAVVNYETIGLAKYENSILMTQDISDATKYIEYREQYSPIPTEVAKFIRFMEQTRSQRRSLYQQMISTGIIPEDISGGKYISIWGGVNASK